MISTPKRLETRLNGVLLCNRLVIITMTRICFIFDHVLFIIIIIYFAFRAVPNTQLQILLQKNQFVFVLWDDANCILSAYTLTMVVIQLDSVCKLIHNTI